MTHDTAHKAIRNVFFSGARLVVTMLATLCTSAIIARDLGPANMGVYGYAMWLVGALGVLANVGLPAAITKYISEFLGSGDAGTAILIGRRLMRVQLAIALAVSAATACFALLRTPYRAIVVLAAIMILAQALQQSLIAALAGLQRFDRIAFISIYMGLAQLALVGVAALFHSGVVGMLSATLGGLWIGAWLLQHAVNDCLRISADSSVLPAEKPEVFRRILRFSFTISYVLLLDMIVWQRSEVLFLKWLSSLPQIAFYTLAYSMASRLNDVGAAVSSTLLPLYSEHYGRSGLREVGQVFVGGLKYLQILMVPICLLAFVMAKPLTLLLYGPAYLPLVLPLKILLGSIALTSLGAVNSTLLLGAEKQSFIATFGTVTAVLNITLDLLLIPTHGALGAAIANSSAQIIGAIGGTIYTLHFVKVRFPWKATATIYCAAVAAVAVPAYYFGRHHSDFFTLAWTLAAALLIYVVILVAAGELGKRDVKVLKMAFLRRASETSAAETIPVS